MNGITYLDESDLKALRVPENTYFSVIREHTRFLYQWSRMDYAGFAAATRTALKFDKWPKLTTPLTDC